MSPRMTDVVLPPTFEQTAGAGGGAHTAGLSEAEIIFAQRMLPHFMAGKSPVEAAQSVLDDDVRILNTIFANNRRGVEAGVFSEVTSRVQRAAIAAAKGGAL